MRIVVAMSGGVDSSTVAGLLHEAGHEVIGVTLQLYDHGAATGRKGACCAGQDIHDARRVADHLGIPHYVIDAEARFAEAVIADFADSYAAGETPVPCIRCNQTVKFTDLVGARAAGSGRSGWRPATMSAASMGRTARNCTARRPGARPELVPVRDDARAARLLPCFRSARCRTRRRCAPRRRGSGCRCAEKPDSQDICFVPSGQLRRGGRPAAPGRAGAGRDRRRATAACSAAMTASRDSPSGQVEAARPAASTGCERQGGRWTARPGSGGGWWSARASGAGGRVFACAK